MDEKNHQRIMEKARGVCFLIEKILAHGKFEHPRYIIYRKKEKTQYGGEHNCLVIKTNDENKMILLKAYWSDDGQLSDWDIDEFHEGKWCDEITMIKESLDDCDYLKKFHTVDY
jgi:hypothetical protein